MFEVLLLFKHTSNVPFPLYKLKFEHKIEKQEVKWIQLECNSYVVFSLTI